MRPMAKSDLGSWDTPPDVVKERARKLVGEASDRAGEARDASDVSQFEYWRGVVDGIQSLLDNGSDSQLLKDLTAYSVTLRNLGPL